MTQKIQSQRWNSDENVFPAWNGARAHNLIGETVEKLFLSQSFDLDQIGTNLISREWYHPHKFNQIFGQTQKTHPK